MEKNVENKIQTGNFLLNALEKMVKMERKYGFFNLLKSVIIIGICVIFGIIILNPDKVIEVLGKMAEKQHSELVDKRISIEPEIRLALKELRISCEASRTFLMECHNGTNNLNGMPFLYADMKYEDVANGVSYLDFSYQNQPLSRFPLASYLFKNNYWYGSIEELSQIDERLAFRIKSNNTEWLALIVLKEDNKVIGMLGVSFPDIPDIEQQKKVGRKIRDVALNLSILLYV